LKRRTRIAKLASLPRRQLLALALGAIATHQAHAALSATDDAIDITIRSMLDSDDPDRIARLVAPLAVAGEAGAIAPLIQLLYWLDPDLHPPIAQALATLAGQDHGADWMAWMAWQQQNPRPPYAGFPRLLSDLLAGIDARYASFLKPDAPATIRWEELVWGSLTLDGVPALDHPDIVPAVTAEWLADSNTVFAARINGIPRAWPHRLMVWHEILNDTIGGQPISLTYCLLSGAPVLYATNRTATAGPAAAPHSFGTTGLLYRSNKLMYDRATDTLWHQISGRPVLGPLAATDERLTPLPLVTTTWGAWRAAHPETTVLSIETGYRRDYAAGAAYAGYFSSPTLYFPAALPDDRLSAKSRVFGVRLGSHARAWPLARFAGGALLRDRLADHDLTLVGDGAAEDIRAYRGIAPSLRRAPDGTLSDATGPWTLAEDVLTGPSGQSLPRLPGHTAYWFAWENAFPGTLAP
jgi:hypothetical protein